MKAVFASDFDNTMTSIDFYRVIMDKYPMGSEAEELYQAWQAQKLKDLDFLGYIFEHYGQDEATLRKDILSTPVDPKAVDFVNWFTDNGGMFYIISAGCRLLYRHYSRRIRHCRPHPRRFQSGQVYRQPV